MYEEDMGVVKHIEHELLVRPPSFREDLGEDVERPLGLGGAYVYNIYKDKVTAYLNNRRVVGGCIQFFRRQCYEDIGGYYPGAWEDSVAVTMARMKGWKVESFPDIRAYHHKCAGLPGRGQLRAKFHVGKMEHVMGDHILYEVARCAGDFLRKPVAIGSIFRFLGYSYSALSGNLIQVPAEVAKYNRDDQLKRLRKIIIGK